MSVHKDMTYRLADKFRRPGGSFNGVTFVFKYFVPGSTVDECILRAEALFYAVTRWLTENKSELLGVDKK